MRIQTCRQIATSQPVKVAQSWWNPGDLDLAAQRCAGLSWPCRSLSQVGSVDVAEGDALTSPLGQPQTGRRGASGATGQDAAGPDTSDEATGSADMGRVWSEQLVAGIEARQATNVFGMQCNAIDGQGGMELAKNEKCIAAFGVGLLCQRPVAGTWVASRWPVRTGVKVGKSTNSI